MDNRPFVSTIINNYNYGEFIAEAVDSALAQTYARQEILVVDDGSTDRSREIILSYGDRVRPIFKPNGGQRSAYNAGLRASRGELVCFLDSDDVWLPERIEKAVQAMSADQGNILVYNRIQQVDRDGSPKDLPWPATLLQGSIRDKSLHSGGWWPCPPSSALCFRSSFLRRIGGVAENHPENPRYGADSSLTDLAPFFGKVAGLEDILTLYRVHGQNHFGGAVAPDKMKERRRERARRLELRVNGLNENLSRLGMPERVRLEDNLPYRWMKFKMGVGGFLPVSFLALRFPAEPSLKNRIKGAVKVLVEGR